MWDQQSHQTEPQDRWRNKRWWRTMLCEAIPAQADKQAEAHTRGIKDTLGNHKAHWEEQVGGWDEWEHKKGKALET